MEKRLVTRYAMRSSEDADENQRRVEGCSPTWRRRDPTT